MATSKKVWLGVVVLAALALLGPTTVYAQRQRAAAEAEAARAQQIAAEAARWNAMAAWYKSHPSGAPEAVYDSTGANVNMLRPEPAPEAERNWYDARQQQFAGPSAVSTSPVPTLVPQGP